MAERIVSIPERVLDLYGLLLELKRSSFSVINVGADRQGTYAYLEETEEKDPIPVMESWIGKPAPEPTLQAHQARVQEAAEAAALAEQADAQPSLLRRIWRTIF